MTSRGFVLSKRRQLFRPAWPLVACLGVALLWPAGETWWAWAAMPVGNRSVGIGSGPGWFALNVEPIGPAGLGSKPAADAGRIAPEMRDLRYYSAVYSQPGSYRFWCPLWILTTGSGLWAVGLVVSRARRAARERPGRCRRCGYDLRATPGRCPECGAVTRATTSVTPG